MDRTIREARNASDLHLAMMAHEALQPIKLAVGLGPQWRERGADLYKLIVAVDELLRRARDERQPRAAQVAPNR